MISATTFLTAELVGAALLALWVAVRFPRLGPRSLRAAAVVSIVAFLFLRAASVVALFVVGMPHGPYLALFGCALPGFFAAFLAAAWLMRVLAEALPGSGGGGGGHRVPLRGGV
jgi:hypothetical protein